MQEIRRVLFLGFNFEKDMEHGIKNGLKRFRCVFSTRFPDYVLYDYDLAVLNLPRFTGEWIVDLAKKKKEIEIFLKASKIVVCVLHEPEEYKDTKGDIHGNYAWLEVGHYLQNNLRKGRGEVVIANQQSKFSKIFSTVFESFRFEWHADMPKMLSLYQIENVDILARNNGNVPVSFVIELKEEYGSGKIVFNPPLAEEDEDKIKAFYISLVNASAQLFKPITPERVSTTSIPMWINDFSCPRETELYAQKEDIETTLQEYFDAKKLLYEKNYFLVPPVALVFEKLGYETEIKESLGEEDIVLKLDDFAGVVEVKGYESEKGKIDRGKAFEITGRLINYLKDYEEEIETKPIVVVNYEVRKHPAERRLWKDVFTERGIEVFKSNNAVVVSSSQLFEIYSKLVEEDNMEYKIALQEKLRKTSGLFELE